MTKYDFDLNLSTKNSNSSIAFSINPNSTILEVGCAYGRLTKYLHSQGCQVTIMEIDEESGSVASQWAERTFLGKDGDVENINNLRKIKQFGNYDYIIFADVLEHLYYPEKVLSETKNLLNTNGSVLISIPNIAHNSVIIDLIQNKFEYRPVGLLDNTHIRFFTESSLEQMVEKCGFTVFKKDNLYNSVQYTEFNNSYSDLPDEVANFLKTRPGGEIYQFVWELKCVEKDYVK